MNEEEKERLIKKDILSVENRVRHAFNQGYEMGLKERKNTCEDAVSRNLIIQTLNKMDRYVAEELTLCDTDKKFPKNEVFIVDDVYEEIVEQLPPVKPQYTGDEIQKIQDLEQAEIEKAYELGKAVQLKTGHWIDHYDEDAKEGWYECDRCHTERAFNTDYCPDCGAKMVEPREGEE
jgi:hypothetical protein